MFLSTAVEGIEKRGGIYMGGLTSGARLYFQFAGSLTTGDYTLRVKMTTPTSPGTQGGVGLALDTGGPLQANGLFFGYVSSQTAWVFRHYGATTSDFRQTLFKSIPNGKLIGFHVVRDTGAMHFYMNGEKIDAKDLVETTTGTAPAYSASVATNTTFCSGYLSNAIASDSIIYEARFYNKSLTEAEITSEELSGACSPALKKGVIGGKAGCVADLDCAGADPENTSVVTDLSGNGSNNGFCDTTASGTGVQVAAKGFLPIRRIMMPNFNLASGTALFLGGMHVSNVAAASYPLPNPGTYKNSMIFGKNDTAGTQTLTRTTGLKDKNSTATVSTITINSGEGWCLYSDGTVYHRLW